MAPEGLPDPLRAVHLATGFKVDVFVVGGDPFDAHRVAQGQTVRVGAESGAELRVDTAEHTGATVKCPSGSGATLSGFCGCKGLGSIAQSLPNGRGG
jgi:hypothetical protein